MIGPLCLQIEVLDPKYAIALDQTAGGKVKYAVLSEMLVFWNFWKFDGGGSENLMIWKFQLFQKFGIPKFSIIPKNWGNEIFNKYKTQFFKLY